MKEYPETHVKGYLSIEQNLNIGLKGCDLGIQIAKDGRVWIRVERLSPKVVIAMRQVRKVIQTLWLSTCLKVCQEKVEKLRKL